MERDGRDESFSLKSNESVAPLHPPTGGDDASDARHHAGRVARVPVHSARGAARGRLSDDPGADFLSRGEPGRHHLIRFWWHDAGHERVTEVTAVADGSWPGYFCGTVDLRENPLGPLRDERPAECGFDFPTETGEVRNVFVIAAYTAEG